MDRTMGKNISENLKDKYSHKFFDHTKKSATYPLNTTSKVVTHKTATGNLISNKIADKVVKVPKTLQ